MSDIAIRVENVSKRYRLGQIGGRVYKTLRESLTHAAARPARWIRRKANGLGQQAQSIDHTPPAHGSVNPAATAADGAPQDPDIFWALKDVSFEVRRGEVLGIIGRNGAGKSTLLKILSRITEPTEGCIDIFGRVASLLEVGTGFHPELTGRENVFLNGAILGMSRVEIRRKFDEIVDFSGVERFLDTPFKRYSSGMRVRLGFAVAAHLEPEILIVDEVLAVGDVEFQSKCIGKMDDVARSGRTVLFVSHNMAAVESLCTRAILLERGIKSMDGSVGDVVDGYLKYDACSISDVDLTQYPRTRNFPMPLMTRLQLRNLDGEIIDGIPVGGDAVFEVTVLPNCDQRPVSLTIAFCGPRGEKIFACDLSRQSGKHVEIREPTIIACTIRNCRLNAARYGLSLSLKFEGHKLDAISGGLVCDVHPRDVYNTGNLPPAESYGYYLPETEWRTRASSNEARDVTNSPSRS